MRGVAVQDAVHVAKTAAPAAFALALALAATAAAEGDLVIENVKTGTTVYLEEDGDLRTTTSMETGLPAETPDGALVLTRGENEERKIVLSDTKMQVENGVRQDNISDALGGDLAIDHIDHPDDAPRAMVGSQGDQDGVLALAGKAYPEETWDNATYYVDGMAVFEKRHPDDATELAYLTAPAGKTVFEGDQMVNHYHITDHLGSTRLVLTDEGQVVEAISYMAYGAMHSLMSPAGGEETVREKFTGKEFDTEGGCGCEDDNQYQGGIDAYHFGARMYDPEVGVWLAADPMGQYWNGYSYTGGRPVSHVDPDGCWSCQSEAESIAEANACTEAENDIYDETGETPETNPDVTAAAKTAISSGSDPVEVFNHFQATTMYYRTGQGGFHPYLTSEDFTEKHGGMQGWSKTDLDMMAKKASGVETPKHWGETPQQMAAYWNELETGAGYENMYVSQLAMGSPKEMVAALGALYEGSTEAGESALNLYAQRWNETGNPVYLVGGGFSALWTSETAPATAVTLTAAWSVAGWAARTGGAAAVPSLSVGSQGNNYLRLMDSANRIGVRIDKAHVGHAAKGALNWLKAHFPHVHFWSW